MCSEEPKGLELREYYSAACGSLEKQGTMG
jgi:hypothetical protein